MTTDTGAKTPGRTHTAVTHWGMGWGHNLVHFPDLRHLRMEHLIIMLRIKTKNLIKKK